MTNLHSSLAEISKQYTIFVKDQVLTEQQLNSLSAYLDDQNRLTRTALTGIGIVDGLVVSRAPNQLRLSKGLGITADGDLLVNYQPMLFDRFKAYPQQAPEYAPFNTDEGRIPLYQFIPRGDEDSDAKALSELSDDFSNMVFILLAETYIQDKDICTGTDCDNGSRTYTSQTRLLATKAEFSDQLLSAFPSTDTSLEKLQRLYVPAITIEPDVNTQTEWFNEIRNACSSAFTPLHKLLAGFWKLAHPTLGSQFDGNPTQGWANKLTAINNKAASETSRLQYYYEFLADLSEAWNALLDCLAELQPGYLMASQEGAKHLILGGLDGDAPRSDFYPSPVQRADAFAPVLFQINKINALLNQYGWSNINPLKITPSNHCEPSVPGFYQAGVFDHWSYNASRHGKNRYLLGYQADKNNPLGDAEFPLNRRQTSFDFYRIEGVIGKSFSTTESTIRKLIRQHHLPFSVTGALVEGNFHQVLGPVFKPRWGLKDFQYLLKQDLSYQLQDVTQFSTQFKNAVIKEADDKKIREGDIGNVKTQVTTRDAEIHRVASKTISLLNKPSFTEQEQVTFNADISNVIKTAGLFKNDVSKVSSTHFPTTFDQLIVNRTPIWVDWIGRIDREQDKKDTEKHLLPNFINRHPGLEVMNGVPRGGTFVLIYNSSGTVVASGMLSHYIEPIEEETVRPELPKFDPPFQAIPIPGIKVQPSLEFEFDRKFTDFGTTLNLQIDEKIQFQSVYSDVFKDSLGIVRDIYVAEPNTFDPSVKDSRIGDRFADALADQLVAMDTQIITYDDQITKAGTSAEKRVLEAKKAKVQEQMADTMVELADYASKDSDLAAGSGGQKAVEKIVKGSHALRGNQKAIDRAKTGITGMDDSRVRSDLTNKLSGQFGGF